MAECWASKYRRGTRTRKTANYETAHFEPANCELGEILAAKLELESAGPRVPGAIGTGASGTRGHDGTRGRGGIRSGAGCGGVGIAGIR